MLCAWFDEIFEWKKTAYARITSKCFFCVPLTIQRLSAIILIGYWIYAHKNMVQMKWAHRLEWLV